MTETLIKHPPARFRFTLRALFVVVTMVAVALALALRYPDGVGLFLAVLVVLGGWSYLRGNKAGAVGYLAILAAFWLALQSFGPYTSLRNRVVWVVGTERLQQWAVETLDNPPLGVRGVILLDRDTLPEDIRKIAGHHNVVLQVGWDSRISFEHGGDFYHWSIVVGRPGYTPSSPNEYDKIADGVWGYHDLTVPWPLQTQRE
jgi:hypothetical protein